ncbi:MAG TPA: LysR family transcriptional regulator [Bacillota bacterium]|nr:LysR family transcriptional regulator [Bacillota bacterium]HOL09046.1 LysR family transcriptional regulator [Bacillota bacterium]HPO96721.1 LysR family transcriptional regulator [Bacillota bacterium]
MDINQFKTFQSVATYKNFSKAAEELHLTQPAVTLQIKALEAELGELLFERLGRSLNLTPAGEIFLSYVQQILNLSEQAKQVVHQFSYELGRLTIGAGTTTTIFRLPDILHQYKLNHSKIEIQIRNGTSNIINKLVHENSVDVGLVTTIDPRLNLLTFPVFADQIHLIAPPNFPATININQLEAEPLLLFRFGSGFRLFLEEKFRKYNFRPKISMELESIEAIIRFVQRGLGLAFLPEVAVKDELAKNELKIVTINSWEPMIRHTYLILRRDKYLTWPVKAFLEQLTTRNWD